PSSSRPPRRLDGRQHSRLPAPLRHSAPGYGCQPRGVFPDPQRRKGALRDQLDVGAVSSRGPQPQETLGKCRRPEAVHGDHPELALPWNAL
ncbi:hypothetical protein PENTCL1PPCAC_10246, partial [Pristionchus entomophagus]